MVAERAAALARITRTLERHLSQLHAMRQQIPPAERHGNTERVAAYEAVRRKTETWLWYLKVQREANGLVDGEELERRYPIPGPIGSDPAPFAR